MQDRKDIIMIAFLLSMAVISASVALGLMSSYDMQAASSDSEPENIQLAEFLNPISDDVNETCKLQIDALPLKPKTEFKTVKSDKFLVLKSDPEPQEEYISLGEFKLTAYCPCTECSGKWGNKTASGEYAKSKWTVAADTDILPFGTRIYIDGTEYEVQDRGSAVKGKTIDIYFDKHSETTDFGVQYAEVTIKAKEGNIK